MSVPVRVPKVTISQAHETGASGNALRPHGTPVLPEVIYFGAYDPSPFYREVGRWLHKSRAYPFKQVKDLNSFILATTPLLPKLVLFQIDSGEDVVLIDQFIQELTKRDWHWRTQILIVSCVDNPKLLAFLTRRNCDVISQKLTTIKALKGRIDRKLKLLEYSVAQETPEFLLQLATQDSASSYFKVMWNQPLLVESDVWLIPAERFIYRAGDKWILTLIGPPNRAGHWEDASERVQTLGLGQGTWWRWEVENGIESETATWYFRGSKPKLQAGRWAFMGKDPALFIFANDGARLCKFQVLTEDSIEVAPNSSFMLETLSCGDADASDPHVRLNPTKIAHFQPIDDVVLFRKFIDEAMDRESDTLFWRKGGNERFKGNLTGIAEDGIRIELTLMRGEADPLTTLRSSDPNTLYLGNFNSRYGCIFFHARKIELSPDGKKIWIEPERIFYFVQRREDVRLAVQDNTWISARLFRIGKESEEAVISGETQVTDISAGGIGLACKIASSEPLNCGDIRKVKVKFADYQMICDAQLLWQKTPDADSEWTYGGFKFLNLAEKDRLTLQFFVFECGVDTRFFPSGK